MSDSRGVEPYHGVLTQTYVERNILYVGRSLLEAAHLQSGDEIYIRAGEQTFGPMTIRSNATVGHVDLRSAYAAAGIARGDNYSVVVATTHDDESVPTLHLARASNPIAEATAAVAQEALERSGGHGLRVFSIIDGLSGVKGGVATASALIVDALNSYSDGSIKRSGSIRSVRAWNVLLRATESADPLPESTCYAFSEEFRVHLHEARESGETIWVIGHTRFTGREARAIQVEFNREADDGGDTVPRMNRLHMVHMAPTQTAAARAKVGEGANALQKLETERDLISDSDLTVYVGNSGSDFLPDPTRTDANDIENFLFPARERPTPLRPATQSPTVKLLLSGRLDDGDVKGVRVAHEIVRGLQAADGQARHFQFVVVGADRVTEQQLLADTAPSERATLSILPFVPQEQLTQFVATTSLVLLPSSADALGLAAIEGLSLGRPTLVSSLSGIAAAYHDNGMSHWVLPAGDPEPWRNEILRLLQTANTYQHACDEAWTLFRAINKDARIKVNELVSGLALT